MCGREACILTWRPSKIKTDFHGGCELLSLTEDYLCETVSDTKGRAVPWKTPSHSIISLFMVLVVF